jgi:beta-galactosidase
VNGTSLGTHTSSDHIYTWTGVALQAGANVVQATGNKDGTAYTDAVTWMH